MGEIIRAFIHPIANAIRYDNFTLDSEIPVITFCLLQSPFHAGPQPLRLDYEMAFLRVTGKRTENSHVDVTPLDPNDREWDHRLFGAV